MVLVAEMPGYVPTIPTIPKWFPVRKAAQVTAFFAIKSGGRIKIPKATKLIYLADRLSMERRNHHITSDDFVSMTFGPVNTYTYNYMNGQAIVRQQEWEAFIIPRKGNFLPVAPGVTLDTLDELGAIEFGILEETWFRFKDINRFALADWTDKYCPEWRNPHGSPKPIDFSTVFKILEKQDPVELAEKMLAGRSLASGSSRE